MKLHLGCGKRSLPGYIHVDLSDYPHIDYVHDIRTLPMFEDNSIELIYASHVLEYFDRSEAPSVLQEWYRVLKPDGILRLAVPDFEGLIGAYSKHPLINLITGPIYGRWEVSPGVFIHHKIMYDYRALAGILKTIGFKNMHRWNWRRIFIDELKDFDDYSRAVIPHTQFEDGISISLNVESTK